MTFTTFNDFLPPPPRWQSSRTLRSNPGSATEYYRKNSFVDKVRLAQLALFMFWPIMLIITDTQLDYNRFVSSSRLSRRNAPDCGARCPGFDSRPWQLFLCLLSRLASDHGLSCILANEIRCKRKCLTFEFKKKKPLRLVEIGYVHWYL